MTNSIKTDDVDKWLSQGVEAHRRADLALAEHFYQKINTIAPNAKALSYLSNIFLQRGSLEQAFQSVKHSLSLNPNSTEALVALADVLDCSGQHQQSYAVLAQCLKLDSTCFAALQNMIGICIKLAQLDEAREYCQKVLAKDANNSVALVNLAYMAELGNHADTAVELYNKVLANQPDNVYALTNLGKISGANGDFGQAQTYLMRAVETNPLLADAQYNLALIQLRLGNFVDGWQRYQWRIMRTSGRRYATHPASGEMLPLPSEYVGSLSKRSRLLVLADQGIGDELFFLRYAARLAKYVGEIYYRPTPKIAPLIAAANLPVTLLPEQEPLPLTEYCCLVGELPLLAGMVEQRDIEPLLTFNLPDTVFADIEARLAKFPRPWIGITWRAGTAGSLTSLDKSVPIDLFLSSLPVTNGSYFIVQRHPESQELAKLSATLTDTLVNVSHLNDDLVTMAALLARLDEYVGVSNTNTHIREGMEQVCRVLIPRESEFRWMVNERVSPWFPKAMAYREDANGWSSALTDLHQHLQHMYGN